MKSRISFRTLVWLYLISCLLCLWKDPSEYALSFPFPGLPMVNAGPLDNINCDPCINRSTFEIQAILHGSADDYFWLQAQATMQQTAQDMGVNFTFSLISDTSEMANRILRTIRYELDDSEHGHTHDVKQIDALIVNIPDDTVQAAVKYAVDAGIHVFGLEQGYEMARETGVLGFVSQDEYLAGQFAAEEFIERQYKLVTDTPRRALYVNHDKENRALQERFRGFNETLSVAAGIQVEQLIVEPILLYESTVDVYNELKDCPYDFVLVAGAESIAPVLAAFEYHGCSGEGAVQPGVATITPTSMSSNYTFQIGEGGDADSTFNSPIPRDSLLMLIGAFDDTPEAVKAIEQSRLEFTFSQQVYLQSALPIIMATTYASTGSRLMLPDEELVYLSGPKLLDRMNLPSNSFMTCEAEAFPVCPNNLDPAGAPAKCPCTDRAKLRIAGVVHGRQDDAFWDTIVSAAQSASHDMRIELLLERLPPEDDDELLHNAMSQKIRSLCTSGVDGIFVSLPSSRMNPAVRFCQSLDIPVVAINAGEEFARELGIQFIGQIEYVAGYVAGERLIQAGMKQGYCIRNEVTPALDRRCLGFAEAIEAMGGEVDFGGIVTIPSEDSEEFRVILEDIVGQEGTWKGIALLVSGPIEPVLDVQYYHQLAMIGTFDVKQEIFEFLDNGRILFAVDQQQYLQGSMPVYLLTYAAYTKQTLLNTAIETGPKLVEFSPSEELQVCEQSGFEICPTLLEEDFNYIGDQYRIAGYLALSLVGFASLVSLVWMHVHKEKNIVKASQPLFLHLVVLGAFLSSLSVFPFGVETSYRNLKDPWTGRMTDQENPDVRFVDAACMTGPWLYGLGFAIVFSALCAKVARIKIIYEAGQSFRRIKVTVSDVMSIMAGIVAVEVGILLSWTLISPSRWSRIVVEELDGFAIESRGECGSDSGHWFFLAQVVFHAICLFYALILSWQAREIPTEFAEGSWINLVILIAFQITALAIPIGALTREDPDAYYFVRIVAVSVQNFIIIFLIFGPKMIRVSSGDDELPLPSVAGRSPKAEASNKAPVEKSAGALLASSDDGLHQSEGGPSQPYVLDSFSDTDDSEENRATDYSYNKNAAQESAPLDRMASLDSNSESSPLEAMMDGTAEGTSEGDNDELANLAAEISRAKETRTKVFAAVGQDAPPEAKTYDDEMATNSATGLRKMSFSSSSSTATPSNESKTEDALMAFYNKQQQDSTEDDSSDSSSDNGMVMHVAAETQSPKRDFRRMDSDDDDSESSSVGRRLASKKPYTPNLEVLEGSASDFKKSPERKRQFKRQDSPDADESVESRTNREGVPQKPPRRRFQRRGSPDVDSSPDTSSSSEFEGKHARNLEKNPQEGSLVSHENTSEMKLNGQKLHPPGENVDSASTSTGQSAQGISQSQASKAKIFRQSVGTPIRLRKPASQYGELTALASGLTKTSGSFLRNLAASFGSGSLAAASSSQPDPSEGAPMQAKPVKGDHESPSTGGALPETTDSGEFKIDRQNRPHYQVFKDSVTGGNTEGVHLSDSERKSLEAKACDGEVLYFS